MKRLLLSISILAASVTGYSQAKLVKDINSGPVSSTPYKLTVFDGKLVFFAQDSAYGRELHMMDSSENVTMVYNINPGSASSLVSGNFYSPMAVLDNMLYFYADDGTHGTQLFSWDGTNTPSMIKEVNTSGSSFISEVVAYNNKIYFNAYTPTTGMELWVYDPAKNDISLVADIYPNFSSSSPNSLTVYNNKLYFTAQSTGTGRELFVYDDATGNASLVMDIYPGNGSSSPTNFALGNGRLYFTASDPTAGRELYALSDTTVTRLFDLYPGPNSSVYPAPTGTSSVVVWNGVVYFGGIDNTVSGYQLFRYDHKTDKASLEFNINPGSSSTPYMFSKFENKLFFTAYTAQTGTELWSYDGVGAPMLAANINDSTLSGSPRNFTVFNNGLYFTATNSASGQELYVYRDSTLSIHKLNAGADIKVYPNPTSSVATVELNLDKARQLSITLTGITGKTVYQTGLQSYSTGNNTAAIPMQQFTAGIYVYTVMDNNGSVYVTGRLIKQ